MNVKKTKKLAVLSLVLLGVAVVLGIVFFVMFTADMVAFAQTYGPDATPESVDVLFELFSTGTLVTLGLLSLLGVVDVVITIMLAVQTSKFESKVPMIFLLVGLAVGVLKISIFIIHYLELKELWVIGSYEYFVCIIRN